LNRIDDIVKFNNLDEKVIIWIIDILLKSVEVLLNNKWIKASFSKNLKNYIARTGYNKDFGARPLKRAITNTINNPLSIKLLNWEINSWDNIILDINKKWDLIIKLAF
jgi:ATP-dependent Clp protease ATP-binding subunit ClpA